MEDSVSIEGPVEMIDGNLTLRIPLSVGGDKLAPLARGIGRIEGDCLCVEIKPWLAEKLRIEASGLLARALQHEVDHLNGILFIDRMSSVVKASLSSRLKRLQKETQSCLDIR